MDKLLTYTIERSAIIDRDPHAYIVFPAIALLDTDEWLIAYRHAQRRDPWQHPPMDPSYRTVVSRSSDHGSSWSRPEVAPNYDWYGTENPGVMQADNGDVLLTHFRFKWYPLGLAYKRWLAGERVALLLPNRGWTDEIMQSDWDTTQINRARGNDGTFVHISTDRGRSFEQTVRIDTAPFRQGYTRTGAIQLSDGRIAYAVAEHFPPYNKHVYLLTSNDAGRTWNSPTLIAASRVQAVDKTGDWNEPHIAEVAPGEIFCILRDRINHEYLWGCRSNDGGKTWTEPAPTPMYGHPGHLLLLHDGRLLCTYGRRKSPWPTLGIRACLSEDGGRNWNIEHEIVIRDDFPNHNLGYPQTIEYAPSQLFSIYYGEDDTGVTCLQGTWLRLEN